MQLLGIFLKFQKWLKTNKNIFKWSKDMPYNLTVNIRTLTYRVNQKKKKMWLKILRWKTPDSGPIHEVVTSLWRFALRTGKFVEH